jgi:hypothetical protein
MSSTAELSVQPSWSVRLMSIQQIPLVVSWIAAIDPNSEIDEIGIADRMKQEMVEAVEIGRSEYYIGYFEQMPTFFMVGFLVEGDILFLPALKDSGREYEIATLLISPLIAEELHFHLYLQAIQYIFKRDLVGRVVYQIEGPNRFLKSILLRLGFCELQNADYTSIGIWFECRRSAFLTD